ncbi:MAG: hypothetical protein V4642_03580 [Bacteroidota bacterium]
MKTILSILFLVLLFSNNLHAQDADFNILSYYGVGNSLDGQPLIDKTNALRFYPVFAMRDGTDSVVVTIYYGFGSSLPYTCAATRMDEGRYWQVLLPVFTLGEAIQRIEVAVYSKLRPLPGIKTYEYLRDKFDVSDEQLKKFIQNALADLNKSQGDIKKIKERIDATANSIDPRVIELKSQKIISFDSSANKLIQSIEGRINDFLSQNEPCSTYVDTLRNIKISLDSIRLDTNISSIKNNMDMLIKDLSSIKTTASILETVANLMDKQPSAISDVEKNVKSFTELRESLYMALLRDIESNLIDTNFSGPSVKRSDIIISDDFKSVKILYRNYKPGLRHLPALDPAERLGVFRARYVPFAIIGKSLQRPFTGKNQAIFEVGLTFGDAIVSGDDFVLPEFSARRLGVAFAISDKLFDKDAEVMALALTYDFNSFGSIGVGYNFPPNKLQSYVSFGINKKAFEVLLGQIQKLFN